MRIDRLFGAGFDYVRINPYQAKVLFSMLQGTNLTFKQHLSQVYQPMFALITNDILIPGMERGIFQPLDPVSTTIMIMTFYLGLGSIVDENGEPPLDLKEVAAFVLRALGANESLTRRRLEMSEQVLVAYATLNKATRANVAVLGVIFGLSGMSHGFFEALQGNTPTGGMFITAIGEAHRMWPHGSEPAFTLIPNFLISGIAAMVVGLFIILWSLGFIHRRNGATILLLLFILLLLVGGGIAQILFFPWIWLVATRINKPLAWWRKTLPGGMQEMLGKLWPATLVVSSGLMLFALVIAVTGFVPGMADPDGVVSFMLICLASEVVMFPLTFISGFARDLSGLNALDPAVERSKR